MCKNTLMSQKLLGAFIIHGNLISGFYCIGKIIIVLNIISISIKLAYMHHLCWYKNIIY